MEQQFQHAYEVSGRGCRTCQVGAAGYHRLGTGDRTCLRGIRTGLQDLTGSEHQIVYAYEVSGRGCRISRVRNNKSNIPRRYQVEVAGSHEFGTPYRTCLEVSGRGCRISRVRNTRSYTPTRYQDGAAGSHGLGPQIEHAYELRVRTSERTCIRSCRISWIETSERTCIRSCNHVPINVFPQNGGGGDTLGIRLTKKSLSPGIRQNTLTQGRDLRCLRLKF